MKKKKSIARVAIIAALLFCAGCFVGHGDGMREGYAMGVADATGVKP
jgi:hypothetical protein